MKIMIASDIHGSKFYCNKLVETYCKEGAQKLILLGDILYHGPRNALPKEYDPKAVAEILNNIKDEILCVKGNCDSEVDQMMLDFPIMAEYMIMYDCEKMFFATHGNIYNKESLPPLKRGDILLHGHTHIPAAENNGNYIYLNPGSVSIPKGGFASSYMLYEGGYARILDFNGNAIFSISCI